MMIFRYNDRNYNLWSHDYDLLNRTLRLRPTKSNTFTQVSLDSLRNKFGSKIGSLKIDLTSNLYNEGFCCKV